MHPTGTISLRQSKNKCLEEATVVPAWDTLLHIQRTWRIHEVKVHKVIDPKLLQLQDNSAQIGAQDLGVGVLLHFILICFF